MLAGLSSQDNNLFLPPLRKFAILFQNLTEFYSSSFFVIEQTITLHLGYECSVPKDVKKDLKELVY